MSLLIIMYLAQSFGPIPFCREFKSKRDHEGDVTVQTKQLLRTSDKTAAARQAPSQDSRGSSFRGNRSSGCSASLIDDLHVARARAAGGEKVEK